MELSLKRSALSELRLTRHGFHRISDYVPGTVIACNNGVLWITQSGDRRDYVLLPGDEFTSRKRGKILIEAMRDSAVGIFGGKRSQVNRPSQLAHSKPA